MTIRQAHACARKLAQFVEDLRTDDPVGADEGMTTQEVLKAKKFADALFATFDDVVRRVERGFTLIEVMISMMLAGIIAMMLAEMLVLAGRHAHLITRQLELGQQARSRVERTVRDVCHPQEAVTTTWGDVDATSGLAMVTISTTYLATTITTEVARTPCPTP